MDRSVVELQSKVVDSVLELTRAHGDGDLTSTHPLRLLPAGQLSQVGRQFYNTDIEVEILSKEETEKMTYVVGTRGGGRGCRADLALPRHHGATGTGGKVSTASHETPGPGSSFPSNRKCLLNGVKGPS